MKFFFDNNMSPNLAKAMQILAEKDNKGKSTDDQVQITHLRDRFEQNIADEEWIPQLALDPSWIVISGDRNITRNPIRKQVLLKSCLTAFFLQSTWPQLQIWEFAWQFIRRWPLIVERAGKSRPGSLYLVRYGKSLVIDDLQL
ncbi:MAG: hypothetical protein ACREJ2_18140 [Planctomycetota bacterium]